MSRSKVDRETTAAYAASQPLFETLWSGYNSIIQEQKVSIKVARDIVQKIHVKLPQTVGDERDTGAHIEAIVKAWHSASITYFRIFDELANITAPDASEGKDAVSGHEELKAMAYNAIMAGGEAQRFRAKYYKKAKTVPQTGTKRTAEEPAPNAAKRVRTAESLSHDDPEVALDNVSSTTDCRKRSFPSREVAIPLPPSKKVKKTHAQEPDDTNNQQDYATAPQANPSNQAETYVAGKPMDVEKENQVPGVEYTDVTAEVEARLKAKADRRKARRKEKKRKRESVDSAVEPTPVEVASEKPQKKKVKAETTAAAPANASGKRKTDVQSENAVNPAKKRKKR